MQNTITEQNPILWCMNADNILGTLKGRYSNSVQTGEFDKFSVATPLFIPITTKIRKSLSSILRNEGRHRLLTYVIQSLRCMHAERFYPAFSERNSSQLQQGIHYKYIGRVEGNRKKKATEWMLQSQCYMRNTKYEFVHLCQRHHFGLWSSWSNWFKVLDLREFCLLVTNTIKIALSRIYKQTHLVDFDGSII